MGVLNKNVYTAEVDFFGVRAWEASDGDPPDLRARVRTGSVPMIAPERSALALLLPLAAAKLLWNSKAEPRLTAPMMDALRTAAVLLKPDPDEEPGEYSFRHGDYAEVARRGAVAAGDDDQLLLELMEAGEYFEEMLFATVPKLDREISGEPDCTFKASLIHGRRGWWVKVNAPWKGAAFFAMFGMFKLIEDASKPGRDRTSNLDPSVWGLETLCHMYFDVMRGHGFDSMKVLTDLYAFITDVVLADDPEQAFDVIQETLEPWDVDPTPEVAAIEERDVAIRHDMNADLADSSLEDETAERIRQEAKRLRAGREVPDLSDSVLMWRDVARPDPLGDDPTEGDLIAANDAAMSGYAVRLAEERLGGAPRPPQDLHASIGDKPSNLTAAIELAPVTEGELPDAIEYLFGHDSEAWEQLSRWGWQAAAHNSRERFREMTGGQSVIGVYIPAQVDYGRAFAFGYLLRTVEGLREAN